MKRSKTVTVGELLDEFSSVLTSPPKSPKDGCATPGARSSVRQPTPKPPSCGSKITFCTSASARAFCATNFSTSAKPWAPKSTAARKSDWSMRSSSGEIHLFSSWRLYNSRQILALFKEKMYFCTLEAKIQTKTAYFYDKAKRAGSTRHSDE